MEHIYYSGLPHRAVAVWMYLHKRMDKNRQCWPAVGRIASDLGLSRSTVKTALKELEQAGYLVREYRFRRWNQGQTSNLYTLR